MKRVRCDFRRAEDLTNLADGGRARVGERVVLWDGQHACEGIVVERKGRTTSHVRPIYAAWRDTTDPLLQVPNGGDRDDVCRASVSTNSKRGPTRTSSATPSSRQDDAVLHRPAEDISGRRETEQSGATREGLEAYGSAAASIRHGSDGGRQELEDLLAPSDWREQTVRFFGATVRDLVAKELDER